MLADSPVELKLVTDDSGFWFGDRQLASLCSALELCMRMRSCRTAGADHMYVLEYDDWMWARPLRFTYELKACPSTLHGGPTHNYGTGPMIIVCQSHSSIYNQDAHWAAACV